MITRKDSVVRGLWDGIGSGLIIGLWCDYAVSPWIGEQYTGYYISWVVSVILSLSLFCFLSRPVKTHLFCYYVCGRIALVLSLLLNFINKTTFHIGLFPAREVSNAEGFILIPLCGGYLLITELLKLILWLVFAFIKKTDIEMKNNS